MIHPDTEIRFINDKIGYGVVATRFIPKGTITWALDKLDRIFTPEQIDGMDDLYKEVLDKFTYRNPQGNYILCWDNARFVNHSSNSSCITTAYEFEIAVRDIYPGEELTDDYGYLNIDEPFEVLPEKDSDRTIIYPDDLLRYYHLWDEKLLGGFDNFLKVEQPLMPLLSADIQHKARRIANREARMDSIINCYYWHRNGNGNGTVTPDLKERSPMISYPY